MDKLFNQIAKFGIVGIICFGIDYGLMVLLTEVANLEYLASNGISFCVSVVVNYRLSMRFVFTTRKKNGSVKDFFTFIILSVTGLLLTELLMWIGVEKFDFHYMLTKGIVTGFVMTYNFITKKFFLEQNI